MPDLKDNPTGETSGSETQKVLWKQAVGIGISLMSVIGVAGVAFSLLFSGGDKQEAADENRRATANTFSYLTEDDH